MEAKKEFAELANEADNIRGMIDSADMSPALKADLTKRLQDMALKARTADYDSTHSNLAQSPNRNVTKEPAPAGTTSASTSTGNSNQGDGK